MNIKDMCSNGVYAFKDKDKIVYVGSTFNTIAERLGKHIGDARTNKHHNDKLSKLIIDGVFDFIVLETGFDNKMELLDRERYYTELYDTHNNGYNTNVGGCKFITRDKRSVYGHYKKDSQWKEIRTFISDKYTNRRIGRTEKLEIINHCNKVGLANMKSSNFGMTIQKLGFILDRLSSKRDYIIRENK